MKLAKLRVNDKNIASQTDTAQWYYTKQFTQKKMNFEKLLG